MAPLNVHDARLDDDTAPCPSPPAAGGPAAPRRRAPASPTAWASPLVCSRRGRPDCCSAAPRPPRTPGRSPSPTPSASPAPQAPVDPGRRAARATWSRAGPSATPTRPRPPPPGPGRAGRGRRQGRGGGASGRRGSSCGPGRPGGRGRAAQAAAAAAAAAPERRPGRPRTAAPAQPRPPARRPPPSRRSATAPGGVRPQTQAAADAVVSTCRAPAGITLGGTRASAADPGGHPSGLALDYMVLSNTALGRGDRRLPHRALGRARRGVPHLQAADALLAGRLLVGMENRGSPTANHMDHVHVNYR